METENIESIVEKYNKIIQDIQKTSPGSSKAQIGAILDLAITLEFEGDKTIINYVLLTLRKQRSFGGVF